jgi:signal transduction histidine kinase
MIGPVDLTAALEELVTEWSTMVSLEIYTDCNFESAVSVSSLVVREAVANSVHHGLADKIQIRIQDTSELREISVVDNGIGNQGGTPGLGSQTFDALCEKWSIGKTEDGRTLTQLLIRLSE